jgi:hypothetical protein
LEQDVPACRPVVLLKLILWKDIDLRAFGCGIGRQQQLGVLITAAAIPQLPGLVLAVLSGNVFPNVKGKDNEY